MLSCQQYSEVNLRIHYQSAIINSFQLANVIGTIQQLIWQGKTYISQNTLKNQKRRDEENYYKLK